MCARVLYRAWKPCTKKIGDTLTPDETQGLPPPNQITPHKPFFLLHSNSPRLFTPRILRPSLARSSLQSLLVLYLPSFFTNHESRIANHNLALPTNTTLSHGFNGLLCYPADDLRCMIAPPPIVDVPYYSTFPLGRKHQTEPTIAPTHSPSRRHLTVLCPGSPTVPQFVPCAIVTGKLPSWPSCCIERFSRMMRRTCWKLLIRPHNKGMAGSHSSSPVVSTRAYDE